MPCNLFRCMRSNDDRPPQWARGYFSNWDRGLHEPHHRTARPGRPALREGSRSTSGGYNPGVNPSIPSARGLQEGQRTVERQPMAWTPVDPTRGDSFVGTAPNGDRVWAFHNPAGELAPAPATHMQWTNGGFATVTTPGAVRTPLPATMPVVTPVATPAFVQGAVPVTFTPAAFSTTLQQEPPQAVMPVGNSVSFPQYLPAGSVFNGVIDPNNPNAIWVDHPAPGPHTSAHVHAGHDFQFTPGQLVPPNVRPVYTPGTVPMPLGVSNAAPAQTFSVSPWAAATPAIPPAATPAWPTAPAWQTPASWPSPPDWLRQSAPEVALIPTLGLNPVEPSYPHLKWDIAQQPASATVKHVTGRVLVKPITNKDFRQVALYPPHLDLYVTLGNVPAAAQMHARWGPILIRCNAKGDVTVADVLDGVYEYFQKPLCYEDMFAFESWLGGPGDPNYEALHKAYRKRIRSSTNIPEVERMKGFKRVDLLGDNRRWCGLYRVPPSAPGDNTVSFYLYLQEARHEEY